MAETQLALRSGRVARRDIGEKLTPLRWTDVLATVLPDATFKVPYGGREPGFARTIYRLELKGAPGGRAEARLASRASRARR